MAQSLLKTKKPFELLRHWDEYVSSITSYFFSEEQDEDEWEPCVDISEQDNNYLLKADLPGVREEDIQINYNNGCLTIAGKRLVEKTSPNERSCVTERYHGSFKRVFKFPRTIAAHEITGEYKDGILHLVIPVSDAAEQK